jgi:hypothetical protein
MLETQDVKLVPVDDNPSPTAAGKEMDGVDEGFWN